MKKSYDGKSKELESPPKGRAWWGGGKGEPGVPPKKIDFY